MRIRIEFELNPDDYGEKDHSKASVKKLVMSMLRGNTDFPFCMDDPPEPAVIGIVEPSRTQRKRILEMDIKQLFQFDYSNDVYELVRVEEWDDESIPIVRPVLTWWGDECRGKGIPAHHILSVGSESNCNPCATGKLVDIALVK